MAKISRRSMMETETSPSCIEIIGILIMIVVLISLVLSVVPWVFNVIGWLLRTFVDYWLRVNKFF